MKLVAVLGFFLTLVASQTNGIQVDFINICRAPVNLYWLHYNRQSEEFMSTIPPNHMFSQMTDVEQVWRVKWADGSNQGIFGEDIIEEYTIEDLGDKQEIKICLMARIREEQEAEGGASEEEA